MDFELLRLRTTIADELLGHLRGRPRLFTAGPWAQAIYDTTFYGCFRVEIDLGAACRVGVEHVGGDGAFDWAMAEDERRRPGSASRTIDGPLLPPTSDEVRYRVEVVEADGDRGRDLLATLLALDWGEPTPEDNRGRDGVVLSGSVATEAGVRSWITWSPGATREPAKAAFFDLVLRFALDHTSGELADDLARVGS